MAEVCYSAAKTMPFWWMLFVSLLYLSKCKSLKIAAVNIVGNESDEFIEIGPICVCWRTTNRIFPERKKSKPKQNKNPIFCSMY